MKKTPFFLLFIFFGFCTAHATTCTAVANGAWSAPATWSCGHVPVCGDSIVIPATSTVTITSHVNMTACGAPVIISISGSLHFDTGNKLSLPCGSQITVLSGGSVYPGNGGGNSNYIEICNVDIWIAANGPILNPIVIVCCNPLPVELVSFTADCAGGVVLKWVTATETNNDFFSVERTDGTVTRNIGTVGGSGSSLFPNYYSFTDTDPLEGVAYYRLKQTDYNGASVYHDYVAVSCGKEISGIDVYPNPANGSFMLSGTTAGEIITISDLLGNILLTTEATGKQVAITLPAGLAMYFVIVENKGEIRYTSKILAGQ